MGVDFYFPQADAKEFDLTIKCNFCGDTIYDYIKGKFSDDTAKYWNQHQMLSATVLCRDCVNNVARHAVRLD